MMHTQTPKLLNSNEKKKMTVNFKWNDVIFVFRFIECAAAKFMDLNGFVIVVAAVIFVSSI